MLSIPGYGSNAVFYFLFSFKPSVYFILMYHSIIPCNYGHPVFQDKQLTPGDT